MTDLRRFALALPLLALAPAAGAAPPGFEDPQFNKAAVLVLLYDRLDAECARQRRLDAGERARLDAWQARNRLAAVRRRVAELGADPRTRATHQALRRTVENQDGGLGADRCAAMLALVKLPDAQLADTLPGMLARLEAPDRAPASTGSSAGAAAAPTEASTDSRPVARSRSTAELAREIGHITAAHFQMAVWADSLGSEEHHLEAVLPIDSEKARPRRAQSMSGQKGI